MDTVGIAAGRMVLDTNAVLDWLVFADPGARAIADAIALGRVHWLASLRMRDELAAVLGRGHLDRWQPDTDAVLASFDRRACLRPEPRPSWLRCRDADDQIFLDLALAERCDWLITRDRALLVLGRRAATRGLRIVPPCAWSGSSLPESALPAAG